MPGEKRLREWAKRVSLNERIAWSIFGADGVSRVKLRVHALFSCPRLLGQPQGPSVKTPPAKRRMTPSAAMTP